MQDYQQILDDYPGSTVIFGNDIKEEIEFLFRKLDTQRIVVFTGANSADSSGAWRFFLDAINNLDIEVRRFPQIEE